MQNIECVSFTCTIKVLMRDECLSLQRKSEKRINDYWCSASLTRCLLEFGHRGTSRNLLLDSKWLDAAIVKPLLLSAGDIENNPGPKQMTSMNQIIRFNFMIQMYVSVAQKRSLPKLTTHLLVRSA